MKLNTGTNSLRKFGFTLVVVLSIISLILFLRHNHQFFAIFIIAAGLLFITAIVPAILKPLYIFWMKLAFVLSWINTRLILILTYYLLITPIGIIIRVFGKDLLDRAIKKDKDSYWLDKPNKILSTEDYQRQF